MNAQFGEPNSWLGGDADEDLPTVVGCELEAPSVAVMVLLCGSCEQRYGLPEDIDDVLLLEMCPRCANAFGSGRPSQQLD